MIPDNVLKQLKTKKILIQLPEGLKPKAAEISRELRENGFEAIVSGDPCFGACDTRKLPGATTLHVGHAPLLHERGIVYWEWFSEADVRTATENALPMLGKSVAIITTIQHAKELGKAKAMLERSGKEVTIPKLEAVPGQVLGCTRYPELNVDTILFIGTGLFHPIQAAAQTAREVVAADPFTNQVQRIDATKYRKEKALRMTKASNARTFGIIVSSKPGQENWSAARTAQDKILAEGKEAFIVRMDLITPDALENLGFDAFVITACPRIAIDDWKNYKKPVLLPDEA
ncbi:MAG: diphthamide biosynthesis enzyme Dph2 [Candidatus Diapherotrites archaeon]|nr:diphthamide biosynthesis enzyme Dph2 [Candidatus Diapherotrites archaeon]